MTEGYRTEEYKAQGDTLMKIGERDIERRETP